MKIKLNADLRGHQKGEIIEVDEKDYNAKIYWQRRLQDAKIDNCCEIFEEKETKKNKTKETDKKRY